MVRFATVREFRVNASKIFNGLKRGDKIVVTRNGKPIGVLQGVLDEDLEDFILANHPAYRARHATALKDYRRGKTRTLQEILGL